MPISSSVQTSLVCSSGRFPTNAPRRPDRAKQQAALADWWLKHKIGAKLPTWDLAVSAVDDMGCNALLLVEAEAHSAELSEAGKPFPTRKTPDQQERSEENHAQIARAISEANSPLQVTVPGILLSREESYQLSNRIAFAWKLASLGVPTECFSSGQACVTAG